MMENRKVMAISPPLVVGDTAANEKSILQAVTQASESGAALLVMPLLCTTGATCGALFQQKLLLDAAESTLLRIAADTKEIDVAAVVSVPLRQANRLFACAALLYKGELLGVVPLETGRLSGPFSAPERAESEIEIGGRRYPFYPFQLFRLPALPDFKISIFDGNPKQIDAYAKAGTTLLLHAAASPVLAASAKKTRAFAAEISRRINGAYLYCDAPRSESTSQFAYGGQVVIARGGEILAEAEPFGAAYASADITALSACTAAPAKADEDEEKWRNPQPFVPSDETALAERCEEILSIQSEALRRRITHIGAKTLVIGVSGGQDSTLAMLVARRALDLAGRPATDILGITMPCFGTTQKTRDNAEMLTSELGATLRIIDIAASVRQHLQDIGHAGEHDVTYENAQARERTQVLMDVANTENGIVIGTGDMSELAIGWCTFNGDHMSMYSVNGGVPKTLVRALIRHEANRIGGKTDRVLRDILDTPVSPELLPAKDGVIQQKTEDIVGPYELHDYFMYQVVRLGDSPREILRHATEVFKGSYSEDTIRKWLAIFIRRFFAAQFKRSCQPDGPAIGSVSLAPGQWIMPSDASAAQWLANLES